MTSIQQYKKCNDDDDCNNIMTNACRTRTKTVIRLTVAGL